MGDRVLGDPGPVEGDESELVECRVGGVCLRTPGGEGRDAQGLDLRLQAASAAMRRSSPRQAAATVE